MPMLEYHKIIEIDLNEIKEPLLACPNDPDDVKPLSEVQGTKIDEVFIGSCMTNIGHFRAAGEVLKQLKGSIPTRLWISPPTKMDQHQLTEEGIYAIFGSAGCQNRDARMFFMYGQPGQDCTEINSNFNFNS